MTTIARTTLGLNDVALLQRAVELARQGRKDEARALAAAACLANPFSEKAWLWRASLASSTKDAVAWLERVLALNPNHETARNWMAKLRPPVPVAAAAAEVQVAAEPVWVCPFCSVEKDREYPRCPECAGYTQLDLTAIEANAGANERQLRHAAEHYAKVFRESGDPAYALQLGLCHLNLRGWQPAYKALQAYFKGNIDDQNTREVLYKLGQRELVLAVDDSPTVRAVVTDGLERAFFRVITAHNALDALGILREETPVFILTDVSMPVMDGYQLCKAIKSNPKCKNIPVVMLSGNDGFIDKVRGKMAGAADYLFKPFDAEMLLAAIRKQTTGKN